MGRYVLYLDRLVVGVAPSNYHPNHVAREAEHIYMYKCCANHLYVNKHLQVCLYT